MCCDLDDDPPKVTFVTLSISHFFDIEQTLIGNGNSRNSLIFSGQNCCSAVLKHQTLERLRVLPHIIPNYSDDPGRVAFCAFAARQDTTLWTLDDRSLGLDFVSVSAP